MALLNSHIKVALLNSHIKVALMGKGIFWLKLSSVRATRNMVKWSSIAIDRKIILLVPWYKGFSAVDFDSHFSIPYHQITLHFPSLNAKLRPIIKNTGTHFRWVM